MSGSIEQKGDLFRVSWYWQGKRYRISRYHGEPMLSRRLAEKLLAAMQADVERGIFRIEKFIGEEFTDVSEYLDMWIEAIAHTLSPATINDYQSSIKNHLKPFFRKYEFQLHEIQYDVLLKLLNSIKRSGKGKLNTMYCLRACLEFAWRSGRIKSVPPFPERKHYGIQQPEIVWLPEDRQMAIIDAIPEEHRPIFLFLKYHLRRPSEAMALHKEDYDSEAKIFTIRRGVSARQVVERTKTGAVHVIPCHPYFVDIADRIVRIPGKYFFTCRTSRKEGYRYSQTIMAKLWHDACNAVGEKISMYAGLKHSSCSQLVNEGGLSLNEVQILTDHARLDSVKRYAKVEVARKLDLMKKAQVIRLQRSGTIGDCKQKTKIK